jgi:alkanesulfonate monooxygenase SsuD/methylene tetrahydromethanopterin reductase-like flavin-dependent oxidoreductase (luciferase family)
MKFGIYDHMDGNDQSLGAFYEDRLRLAEAYDRLGYFALQTAEHHSTPLGMAPSPSVFHAAVAQRTSRLKFGPLVYTLNLYHPLRLADEICMLDHMSGGRLLLGVGRGISPFEVGYFGGKPEDGQAMYVEALAVVLKALSSEVLTHEGRFYNYRDVPIMLHPLQTPHPPLWYGIGTVESVPWCAANTVHVVANGTAASVAPIAAAYRAEWRRLGQREEELPFIGTTRHMVLADTDAEALSLARRGYERWAASYFHLFKKHNAKPRFQIYSEDFDEVHAKGLILAGTAQTVGQAVERLRSESGANYLACRFAFGDLPYAVSLSSAERFAKLVAPRLAGGAR